MKTQSKYVNMRKNQSSVDRSTVTVCISLAFFVAHVTTWSVRHYVPSIDRMVFNPLNAELNPICHLLALLGAHHVFHVSGLRVNDELESTGRPFYRVPEKSSFIA